MGKISQEIFMNNSPKIFERRKIFIPSFHSLTSLISTIYNCGHMILLVPFKVKHNPITGLYFIEKAGRIRQLLVILVQMSAMIPTLWAEVIDPVIQGRVVKKKLAIAIFSLVLLSALNFYMVTWRGSEVLETIVNRLYVISKSMDNLGVQMPTTRKMRVIGGILTLYFFLWGTLDVSTVTLRLHKSGLIESFQNSVRTVQSSFRLPVGDQRNMTFEQTPWSHLTLTVVVILGKAVANFGTRLPDLICFSYALVHFLIMRHFVRHLNLDLMISDANKINSVMGVFDHLTELSREMNEAVGSIVFCSCFCLLPYNSMQFLIIFMADVFQVLRVLSFFVTFGLTLIIAAEANAKVGEFTRWLQQSQGMWKFRDLDERIGFQQKLSIVQGQIQMHEVGIRGKCFTITYGFVGNLASLVITYAIVFVQLQSPH